MQGQPRENGLGRQDVVGCGRQTSPVTAFYLSAGQGFVERQSLMGRNSSLGEPETYVCQRKSHSFELSRRWPSVLRYHDGTAAPNH
jgi:hypothetical protein